jgi:ubiquitin-activating enzyme E1
VVVKDYIPLKNLSKSSTSTSFSSDEDISSFLESESGNLDEAENILNKIPKVNLKTIKLNPIEFEKDDDSNHHIDFISSCSNIRGWNYGSLFLMIIFVYLF